MRLENYPIANCDNAAGKIEQIRLLDFGMLWLNVLSLCIFVFFWGFSYSCVLWYSGRRLLFLGGVRVEDGDVTPAQAAEGPPPFMSARPGKEAPLLKAKPIKFVALGLCMVTVGRLV